MQGFATRKIKGSRFKFRLDMLGCKKCCRLDSSIRCSSMQPLCKQGRTTGITPVLHLGRPNSNIFAFLVKKSPSKNVVLLPTYYTTKPVTAYQTCTVQAESSFSVQGAKSTSCPFPCHTSLTVPPFSPKTPLDYRTLPSRHSDRLLHICISCYRTTT